MKLIIQKTKIYTSLKYVICISISLLSYSSWAQHQLLPLNQNNEAFYSDHSRAPYPKSELFKKAQSWISKTFGNYQNAVMKEDSVSGILIVNSYLQSSTSTFDHIRFTLILQIKDNYYEAKLEGLEGISKARTPARLGKKENDLVAEKEILFKTETNKKKRAEAKSDLQIAQSDNENVNNIMFQLLGSLKESLSN